MGMESGHGVLLRRCLKLLAVRQKKKGKTFKTMKNSHIITSNLVCTSSGMFSVTHGHEPNAQ
jgi:hypothetical protein